MGNASECLCCRKSTVKHLQSLPKHNKPNAASENNIEPNQIDNLSTFHLPIETKSYLAYFTQEQIDYYDSSNQSKANIEIEYINNAEYFFNANLSRVKCGMMIGKGNFSTIYQCFNTDDGSILTLKRMNLKEIVNDENQGYANIIQMTQAKMDLLLELSHKNIINHFGVFFTHNQYLDIYLELCAGGSLMSLYQQFKCFDEKLIRKYTQQILQGVEYLHRKNIVHGDIKCSNILIDRDGICKLTDFGCSRVVKSHCDVSSNKYTQSLNWLAPEVVKGELSLFSDIWSVGCTVIEMLQGAPLWKDCSSAKLIALLYDISKPPPLPGKASFLMRDFLKKCLVVKPTERWNVYQLLRHPFITEESALNMINLSFTENDVNTYVKSLSPQRQESLILTSQKENAN